MFVSHNPSDRTTATGVMINSYLTSNAQQDDHSIHLLFSANRWEAIQGILQAIADGVTVIIDRYSFSGAVYSAAKDNPDLNLQWGKLQRHAKRANSADCWSQLGHARQVYQNLILSSSSTYLLRRQRDEEGMARNATRQKICKLE